HRTPPTRTSTPPLPRRDRSRRPHHPPRRHRATAPPTTQRPDPAPGRGPRKSRPRHPPAHGAHRSHASHRRTRHRVLPHRSRHRRHPHHSPEPHPRRGLDRTPRRPHRRRRRRDRPHSRTHSRTHRSGYCPCPHTPAAHQPRKTHQHYTDRLTSPHGSQTDPWPTTARSARCPAPATPNTPTPTAGSTTKNSWERKDFPATPHSCTTKPSPRRSSTPPHGRYPTRPEPPTPH